MKPEIHPLRDLKADRIKGPFYVLHIGGQVEGAMPAGTRIYKTNTKPGDATMDGQMGTVQGSVSKPDHPDPEIAKVIGYCVIWDHTPDIPCMITNDRIAAVFEELL